MAGVLNTRAWERYLVKKGHGKKSLSSSRVGWGCLGFARAEDFTQACCLSRMLLMGFWPEVLEPLVLPERESWGKSSIGGITHR